MTISKELIIKDIGNKLTSRATWIVAGVVFAFQAGALIKEFYYDGFLTKRMFIKKLGGLIVNTIAATIGGIVGGSLIGISLGAITGAAAGSFVPIFGTIIGGLIGGALAVFVSSNSYDKAVEFIFDYNEEEELRDEGVREAIRVKYFKKCCKKWGIKETTPKEEINSIKRVKMLKYQEDRYPP